MNIPNNLPVPPRKEWQTLDSTKLQCFLSCPRSFFYQYVLGWKASSIDNSLVFGQAWHEALEHLYKTSLSMEQLKPAVDLFIKTYRAKFSEETDSYYKKKSPSQGIAGLLEYVERYADDNYRYKVLETEIGGLVPIDEDRELAIKIDCLCVDQQTGEVCALEHKTSTVQGQSWARQWALSLQIGTYLHTLNMYYENADKVIVNGAFFYTNKREFTRHVCQRGNEAMADWLSLVNRLWTNIEHEFLLLSEDSPKGAIMKSFPKNPTSCNSYAGCPYHDLCVCVQNPLRFVERGEIPIEYEEFWWNPLEGLQKEFS